MANATQNEKIFRVWSDRQQERIAIRLAFSIEEMSGCRLIQLGAREEWV